MLLSSKEIVNKLKKKYYASLYRELVEQNRRFVHRYEFFGPTPPNALVGSYNYPNVRVGTLIDIDSQPVNDLSLLYGKSYTEILKSFALTLNAATLHHVRSKSRILERIQESVLSDRPIDIEVKLRVPPKLNLQTDGYVIPTGYQTFIRDLHVAENPHVPKIVDNLIDEGLNAVETIRILTRRGLNTYYITRLFTTGLLGMHDKKKLVPTRWAITAVDDITAKLNLEMIRTYREIENVLLFENEFLFNRFFVLMIPGRWEYEQFEAWPRDTPWGTEWGFNEEYEPYEGRRDYAEIQAGGYYAARLAVTEHLVKMKRQARAIVFREIDKEYCIPVGVWQVRENVRHALEKNPKRFDNVRDALNYLKDKLKVNIEKYVKKSRILGQRRLLEFF
ncbi:hypothetical protein J7K41_02255 [Candidatus Micrarchaeota archaeon]|nr:hypothetical protein [Candidatus Micrarchaeota archaeon]